MSKAHGDDTFDIAFDDGDVETRVPKEKVLLDIGAGVGSEKRMESVALKLIAAGCDVSLVDKVGVAEFSMRCV